MNRREFILMSIAFSVLSGISLNACDSLIEPINIKKLNKLIEKKDLIHLLRKCTIGFSNEKLKEFENLSISEIIQKLIETKKIIRNH